MTLRRCRIEHRCWRRDLRLAKEKQGVGGFSLPRLGRAAALAHPIGRSATAPKRKTNVFVINTKEGVISNKEFAFQQHPKNLLM